MEKDCNRMNEEFEVPKETPESIARRERADRIWNRQWALDKSVEWCKHINDLTSVGFDSTDVMSIAENFFNWLYEKSPTPENQTKRIHEYSSNPANFKSKGNE